MRRLQSAVAADAQMICLSDTCYAPYADDAMFARFIIYVAALLFVGS